MYTLFTFAQFLGFIEVREVLAVQPLFSRFCSLGQLFWGGRCVGMTLSFEPCP